MLYAHFPDANIFKKILETIQHYGSIMFHFSQTGLRFQGADKSVCTMVHVNLEATLFDSYVCDTDISMAIYLPDFYKIIKLAYKNGGLTITDCDDENQLKVEFASEAGVQRTVDLQSVTAEHVDLEIPPLHFDCVVTIPSGELLQIVQEQSQFFDDVAISNSNNDGIKFVSKTGLATNDVTIKVISTTLGTNLALNDQKTKISVISHKYFSRIYNLRMLKSITKATILSPSVDLKFCTSGVLLIETKILENGSIQFFLAQKDDQDTKNELI